MNFKTTYILFAVLLILIGALGVALYLEPTPPEMSTYVLPSSHRKDTEIKADDVTRVEIKRSRPEEQTIVFERNADGKTWRITSPHTLRAETYTVTGLIREVLDAQREEKADTPPSLKDAGLDPPAEVITIAKEGREVQLNVGEVSPGGEDKVVFVTSSDNPKQSLPVKKNQLDSVFKKLNEFRDHTLLTSNESEIKSIKVSEAKKATVALTKQDDGRWKYTEPAYGVAETEGEPPAVGESAADQTAKAPSGVRSLLNDLGGLRVDRNEDFVADDVEDKDLGKYNLDPAKDQILRIEVDKSAGNKEEEKTLVKSTLLVGVGKADGDKYFARLDGEKPIVKIAVKSIDPLRKLLDKPDALRDRNLVRFDNSKTPDVIRIKNNSGEFELFREDSTKPWQLYRGDHEVKADEKAVLDLVGLITQKNIVRSFPPADADLPKLGLDKPAAVVSLWIDGIAKEEKKEDKKDEKDDAKKDEKKEEKKEEKKPTKPKLKNADKPTVVLSFGKVDGNVVDVKRQIDGETSLVKIPASIFESVKNDPLYYMDRTLVKFNTGDPAQDVTKLVLNLNGKTTELTRDPKAATPVWKFAKPDNLAGQSADSAAIDGILRMLNGLHPLKYVTENADPQVLDGEYGLKTPANTVTVTVTRDGKSTDHTYEFGKEIAGARVYARQGDRSNIVFETDKATLASLGKDLRDPTIFHFDSSKAKSVKMTGWKEVTVTPTTLLFERKDASTWTAIKPEKFPVSSEKLNRLVNELSSGKAVKILDRKVTPKEREEYALSPEAGGLQIEITVEGEKEPYILTVGNLDATTGGYYAIANRLGDTLFTVRKDIFEKPKQELKFFSP
jgi:hypothetical protein